MGRIHLTKSLSDYNDDDNNKTLFTINNQDDNNEDDDDSTTINDFIKLQQLYTQQQRNNNNNDSGILLSDIQIRNSDDYNKQIEDEEEQQKQDEERRKQIIVYVGECKPKICGAEAACMNFQNNSYTCICPHDSSQPTKDFKCPNRRIVPLTPQPIHNIIPPSSIVINNNNKNINNNTTISTSTSTPNLNTTTATDNSILLFNNHEKQNHTETLHKNITTSLIINSNNNNNNKTNNTINTTTIPTIVTSITTITIIGIILMSIILFIFCWYKRSILLKCFHLNQTNHIIKRRNMHNKSSTNHHNNTTNTFFNNATINTISPMNLKKSILLAERYTPNPQYSPCTTTIQSSCTPNISIIKREQLKFIQEIGEGCFGKVFKGELYTNKRDDNDNENDTDKNNEDMEIVAIKVLKQTSNIEAEEDFMREIDIMSTFRHTNILTLIGIVLKDINNNPWMIFEYMEYGDLAEVLRTHCKASLLYNTTSSRRAKLSSKSLNNLFLEDLNQSHLLSAALQIADGMRYLAGQRFVHRDLACRNCLVNSHFIVKIADFGMSRDVYTCDYYKIGGSRLLPIRWMSPESVMYGRFTLESDVWSYGVVLWEIFSYGKQPYYGHNNEEVIKLILHNIMLIPSNDCPTFICDLMKLCWKTEPRDRIRFVDIYEQLYQYINTTTNNITSSNCNTSTGISTTLPRPPPITDITSKIHIDLLDHDGYLIPQPMNCNVNADYMQALPD